LRLRISRDWKPGLSLEALTNKFFIDVGTQLLTNKPKVHAKLERDWDPQKAAGDWDVVLRNTVTRMKSKPQKNQKLIRIK